MSRWAKAVLTLLLAGTLVFGQTQNAPLQNFSAGNLSSLPQVTSYNGLTTAGQGLPVIMANLAVVGQNANITTTNLVPSPGTGRFRVDVYLVIQTAVTAGFAVTIGWGDNVQAQTATTATSGTTAGSFVQQTFFIANASFGPNITYATAGTIGTGTYTLVIIAERLA